MSGILEKLSQFNPGIIHSHIHKSDTIHHPSIDDRAKLLISCFLSQQQRFIAKSLISCFLAALRKFRK